MTVNINAANGFQEFGRNDGSSPTYGRDVRKVSSGDSGAIGFGDPVTSSTNGFITLATAGTTQINGIFYGCEYLATAVGRVVWSPSWPGSGAGNDPICYIGSDPNTLYQVQSLSTAIVFADIDANVQFTIGTPNAITGMSTSTVTQSSLNTTDTLPFRVVGLLSQYLPANSAPGTDDASSYNRVIVRQNFNDRTSRTGIA